MARSPHSFKAFALASIALGAIGLTIPACGMDDTVDPQPDTGSLVQCRTDSRVETYVANLTKTSRGGTFKVILTSAEPAPPATLLNDWTIRVVDAGGAPLQSGTLELPLLAMPDHGHGAPTKPVLEDLGGGNYKLTKLNFFMGGVWKITFEVTKPGAPSDSLDIHFCIP